MAPETIQSSQTDQKTDIWAIGITAFELITSKISDEDVPSQKVIFKIVQQPPRLSGDYPNEMTDFVHQCLQRDSRQRPSATQLLIHPFIRNAKKTIINYFLYYQKELVCQVENNNKPVVKLQLYTQQDATGTPIREENQSFKEETLKIKGTFRKIEKYKPGLGKIVFTLYLRRYAMKSSKLKPRPSDESQNKKTKKLFQRDEDQFNSFTNALSIIQRFHDDIKQQLNPQQPSSRKIRVNFDSEKSNNVSHPYPNPDIREDQDFRRRIPHWAKMMEQDAAYKYLQNVQESKTSKQQRFKLGDLQRLFQVQVNEPKKSKLCKNFTQRPFHFLPLK